MDDPKFDDLLRDKLKDYLDPEFDRDALNDLHDRLDSAKPFSNWNGHRTISIAVASLFLLTGINFYLLLKGGISDSSKNNSSTSPHQLAYNINNSTLDSLTKEIERLQCELVEKSNSMDETTRTLPTEKIVAPIFRLVSSKNDSGSTDVRYRQLILGSVATIPKDVFEELTSEGILYEKDGMAVLNIARHNGSDNTNLHSSISSRALPVASLKNVEFRLIERPEIFEKPVRKKPEPMAAPFSPEARNLLEEHYMRGIGIRIGPHVDLTQSIVSPGTGKLAPRVGITADWILSPHMSIESGIDYSTIKAHYLRNEIPFLNSDPVYGTLESQEVTSSLISSPVSIKYRQWVFDKSQVIARLGYTPYWITQRQLQNNFFYHDSNDPSSVGDHVTTLVKQDDFKYYGNTLTAATGLNIHRKKNSSSWEVLLFYERKLGTGNGGLQLVGLRTGYYFKVR